MSGHYPLALALALQIQPHVIVSTQSQKKSLSFPVAMEILENELWSPTPPPPNMYILSGNYHCLDHCRGLSWIMSPGMVRALDLSVPPGRRLIVPSVDRPICY